MDYAEYEPVQLITTQPMMAGEWYLRGFVDAYSVRVALTPEGIAGQEYTRGYQEGLAAVQREFFAAMCIQPMVLETAEV